MATALAVTLGTTALSLALRGAPGDASPVHPVAPTSATVVPAGATESLDKAVARLRVDLAVARATWAGSAGHADDPAREDLGLAVDDAQSWLDGYIPPSTAQDAQRLTREASAHVDALTTLVAQVRTAQGLATPPTDDDPAPTTAPTPRATTAPRPTSAPPATSTPPPATETPPPSPSSAPTTAPTTDPTTAPTSPAPTPTPDATAAPTDPPDVEPSPSDPAAPDDPTP